jgi:hypothetical protein
MISIWKIFYFFGLKSKVKDNNEIMDEKGGQTINMKGRKIVSNMFMIKI